MDIKKIAKENMPREKAVKYGISTLSDSELLALIIRSGNKTKNVLEIAVDLQKFIAEKKLNIIEPKDLEIITGIGLVKSITLCAALEFSRRFICPEKRKIKNPKDIIPYVSHYSDRKQEHFIVISVNGANEVIRISVATIGILNRALIHPREIFAEPIKDRAAAIFVTHNHPSGNLQPSIEDIKVTETIKKAGELLGIHLLDHIIFNYNDYFSFVENKIF